MVPSLCVGNHSYWGFFFLQKTYKYSADEKNFLRCKVEKAEKIFSIISEAVDLIEKDSASIAHIPTIWKSLQNRFLQVIVESLSEYEQTIASCLRFCFQSNVTFLRKQSIVSLRGWLVTHIRLITFRICYILDM
jgi:hypothetical protein